MRILSLISQITNGLLIPYSFILWIRKFREGENLILTTLISPLLVQISVFANRIIIWKLRGNFKKSFCCFFTLFFYTYLHILMVAVVLKIWDSKLRIVKKHMHNHFAWYFFNQFLESGSKNLDYGLPLNGTFVELLLTMLDSPGKKFRKKGCIKSSTDGIRWSFEEMRGFPYCDHIIYRHSLCIIFTTLVTFLPILYPKYTLNCF